MDPFVIRYYDTVDYRYCTRVSMYVLVACRYLVASRQSIPRSIQKKIIEAIDHQPSTQRPKVQQLSKKNTRQATVET